MSRINVSEMNSEQLHLSRMAMLSESIKSIAFKKQQITKEFEKGDEVEVASQELGFIGSYYAATIICSTGDDYYRIKYKTLLTDDESEPLGDVFSAARSTLFHLINMKQCQKMDSVYTIWLWWFGFISGKIGEEYYVYFPATGDNIAYPRHVLRFHQEWVNGNWKYLPKTMKDFLLALILIYNNVI